MTNSNFNLLYDRYNELPMINLHTESMRNVDMDSSFLKRLDSPQAGNLAIRSTATPLAGIICICTKFSVRDRQSGYAIK